MNVYGATHVGRVRTENQDAFLIQPREDGTVFALVCDGMGGANGGKLASTTACKAAEEYLSKYSFEDVDFTNAQKLMRNAIFAANDRLYQFTLDDEKLIGMGTTMVLAICTKDKVHVANVGDSRAYIYRQQKLQQITTDHSAVQEMVDTGKLTKKQAEHHPQKNIITRAVGIDNFVQADLFHQSVQPGDIILLCSDGLTNHVSEQQIESILRQTTDIQNQVEALITFANENGGRDNITAILIKR